MPCTVTFRPTFCGAVKSLFGSFSSTIGRAPTQRVRISVMPLAVRTRTACSPRRVVGATLTWALKAPAFTGSSFVTVNPGE